MSDSIRRDFTRRLAALGVVAGVLAAVPPAMAGGGNVMPAKARAAQLSLEDLALATAAFNVGARNPADLPPLPFQVLYIPQGSVTNTNEFTVDPGTMFYAPLYYSDDSPPIVGDFPAEEDLDDPARLEEYIFGPDNGIELLQIVVDGKVTVLGPEYLAGVTTDPLPDVPPGVPGGTHYIVAAAVLGPLSIGTHTVEIEVHNISGFIFMGTFTIIVEKPGRPK